MEYSKKLRVWDSEKKCFYNQVTVRSTGDIYPWLKRCDDEIITTMNSLLENKKLIVHYCSEFFDEAGKILIEDDIVELIIIQKNDANEYVGRGVLGVAKYISTDLVLVTKEGLVPIYADDHFKIVGNLRETPDTFFKPKYKGSFFNRVVGLRTKRDCMTTKLRTFPSILRNKQFIVHEMIVKYVIVGKKINNELCDMFNKNPHKIYF